MVDELLFVLQHFPLTLLLSWYKSVHIQVYKCIDIVPEEFSNLVGGHYHLMFILDKLNHAPKE